MLWAGTGRSMTDVSCAGFETRRLQEIFKIPLGVRQEKGYGEEQLFNTNKNALLDIECFAWKINLYNTKCVLSNLKTMKLTICKK